MKPTTKKDFTIEEIYNSNSFRRVGHAMIDVLADYLEDIQTNENNKVYAHQTPDKALEFWQHDFNTISDPIHTFKNIIQHSMHLQHSRYIGHQTAVNAPITSIAGLVADFLNNGTGVYEMGPASNAMERVITDFTAQKIGYDSTASGLLTSGGSLANLTALLAARQVKAPSDIWKDGHAGQLALLVSEEAHYCIDRAARILGLGDKGIIKVPVDKDFKIRIDLLPAYLAKAKNDGLHVFCVVGCAGSTATGSYDDLTALGEFSEANNLWFHVDAAHGGGVVFSKKYKHLTKGIEKGDSVVIDFHKMLMTPALNTALIFKNGSNAYKTFAQKAHYLWDTSASEEWYNSAKRTFECTKSLLSSKVYIILKTYGKDIFEKNIDRLYDRTAEFSKLIIQRSNFELAIEPEANIVNFRFFSSKTQNLEVLNKLNTRIRKELVESGQFYIVQSMINGKRYLRCTVMNPLTTIPDLEALLDEIERIAALIMD